MRLEDLTWMDVEKYLQQDDRLMLVVGATEQHAYLSLLTDVKIPLALADAASQQTGVPVAPPLNFGCSPYFLAYPGTLSLRVSTLTAALEDLVRSAAGQGFRRMLILNGHGGNAAGKVHLSAVLNDLRGVKLDWYDWWLSHSVEEVGRKHNIKPGHANWLEAFPFTMVGEPPEAPKVPPKAPGPVADAKTVREAYGDGSFGGPYTASEEVMHELFAAALNDILLLLKFGD